MSEKLRTLLGYGRRPDMSETPLIRRCEDALDLTMEQQTPETLRLLIGQGIGLEMLMPRALDLLEENPLVAGDLYDGDLMANCQRAPASHWAEHADHWTRLNDILTDFDAKVALVNLHRGEFLANNPFGAAP